MFPQEIILPEEEGLPAIFQAEIGDAEVDFFLSGSWETSLAGAAGILFGPDGTVLFPSAFPGLEAGQPFEQVPDLTFSIRLMERYFIEASIIGNFLEEEYSYFDENYFRMGYEGKEDEFLKALYIGNRDINIAPFRFMDIPESGNDSLGAEALLGSGSARHHLLLRYDNNEADGLTFIGKNLVTEEILPLDSYIQGRFFKLPDSGVENLDVYIEDSTGSFKGSDNRNYRKATLDDAFLDSEQGLVSLKEEAKGRVLVYYRKDGLEIGEDSYQVDDALPAEYSADPGKIDITGDEDFDWDLSSYFGQDMEDRKVAVNSIICLRLWQPGEFSPFEILSSYRFSTAPPEDLSRIRVRVILKGKSSDAVLSPVKFRLIPGADWFTAYLTSDLRASFRNLYPFLDESEEKPEEEKFDRFNLLYGPARDPKAGYVKHELLVGFLTPVSEYRLGENVIAGSVQVLRNGIAETRYEVDYEQGTITFLTFIHPDDRLEIHFRKKEALLNNGDLLFAWGNTIPLSKALTMELAAGLRWNALPGNFTEEAYSRTGTVIGSAALKGEIEHLAFSASAGFAYTNPDTTGIMRLLSMEEEGMEISLTEETAYPAGLPFDDSFTSVDLKADNRGRLFYKDFRSYGVTGTSVLMPYTWDPPADQIFLYRTDSKIGPYLVAGSSVGEDKGQSLVLDFELDSSDWVGTQIPILVEQGLVDLSSLHSVSISYRAIPGQGSFRIYMQLGEIGEDLDGNGKLDEEFSENDAGFSFNDESANGAVLLVGSGPQNTGNGRRDSEDIDGNGFLDQETASAAQNIITMISESPLSEDWKVLTHTFSETERRQLRRVRSLRLLVVADAGTAGSGRVLIDRISLAGTSFWVDTTDFATADFLDGTVTAREIEEGEAEKEPPQELDKVFLQVKETFHPFGEKQKVLEVEWSGGPSTGDWTLQGYSRTGSQGINYRTITLYYRIPELSGGSNLSFSLLDIQGQGIAWNFEPEERNDWSELEVSLDGGKVYIEGIEVQGAQVTIDESYGSLSMFKLSLFDSSAGTLYLDELHLKDPQGAVGAALGLDIELNLPGKLVMLGDHPLISDLKLCEKVFFSTSGFSTLYGRPENAMQISSLTELSFSLSLVDLRLDLFVDAAGSQVTLSGGHQVTFPNISFPLIFSDSFSLRERETGRDLYRQNILQLNLLNVLYLDIKSDASSSDDLLTRNWEADLLIGVLPLLNYQTKVKLQASGTGFTLPELPYLESWIYGYSLILPREETEELERKGDLTLSLSLLTRPFGTTISGDLGFQSFDLQEASRRQRNRLEMVITLPFTLKTGGIEYFSLVPGYRRQLEILAPEDSLGDFVSDLDACFYRISTQEYMFKGVPFGELFAPAAETYFHDRALSLEESFYTAEVFIEMYRSFGSRIRDLFLPSYLELSVDKEFKKEGELFDFFNSYQFRAQSTALNLFGSYGAYPLFSFYKTEEFSTAVTVAITADRAALRKSEVLLENYISLEDQEGNTFTMENRLNIELGDEARWKDSLGLLYTRYYYPEQGIRLPYLSREIGKEGFWAHIESLDVTITGQKEKGSFHPLNLILRHETSIVFPDHGLIKGEIAVGFDHEKVLNGEKYWRLGIRGAIEVRIDF